ncbi:MAG: hypothetical protein IJC55_00140, partial [Clostridia bacterium]|nr:hypothetical protein [Clostridia bacterium]
ADAKILVKTAVDQAPLGEISVRTDTKEWTTVTGTVRIPKGVHPLYFCFEGEGAVDLQAFELIIPNNVSR